MTSLTTIATRFLSRRTLVKGAGAGAAGFTLAQVRFLRSAAAQEEGVQDILDITVTIEQFGVTFLGEGLQSNSAGNFDTPWPANIAAVVTAARAQEQYHLDFFEQAGGMPLVDAFTVPPKFLTSYDAFFGAVVEEETAEVAAQIAAMKTFAALNRPDLVKVSFQYAAQEAEHRVLANYARGVRPANDLAFAPALYTTVAEFLQSRKDAGIIGGTGQKIVFPGPGEIDGTGVSEREPGGPLAACAAMGTPVAGSSTPVGASG